MHAQGTALPAGRGQAADDPGMGERPFTVAQVARFLRKHPNTIYDWIRRGQLEAAQYGGTYYIPRHALAPLLPSTVAPLPAPTGGDAA